MNKSIIAALLMFVAADVSYAQKVKVGYVDKVKVLTELESWQKVDRQLLLMKEDAEFELQIMLREADSLGSVLQNQMMLTETMRGQLQGRIEQLSRDYQRIGMARQQELMQKENDLKGPIIKGFNDAVRKLGINEEYTFIYDLSINSILFASGGRDLTEQVLFEMRKMFK